jgi:uncharacterized protein YcbK (DUF882 family)
VEKIKLINRRAFCLGVVAASYARAANPIIDLNANNSPLVSLDNRKPVFDLPVDRFIDIEPAVHGFNNKFFTPPVIKNLYSPNLVLRLRNVHTGEDMNLTIPQTLQITEHMMKQFNYFCRDWRRNEVTNMDPQLICILAKICEESTHDSGVYYVEILSGYRTHKTNEMLRRSSAAVAKNSFHKIGKALDFRLPNVEPASVMGSAKAHAFGGLGMYKNFIHIDTGPERRWLA